MDPGRLQKGPQEAEKTREASSHGEGTMRVEDWGKPQRRCYTGARSLHTFSSWAREWLMDVLDGFF